MVNGTGKRDAPALIFIPGLGCSGKVWDGAVERFQKDHPCHVLTLAGFAGEPAIAPPFLATVRSELARYIREKKLERPILVGHSLGGFLAFWLASKEPELVGPVVAVDGVPFYGALLAPGASAEAIRGRAEAMREMLSSPRNSYRKEEEARATLSTMITAKENVEKVVPWMVESDSKSVAEAMYEMLTTDLREEAKAIRTPVLLVASVATAKDPDVRRKSEEAYRKQIERIARAKLVVTEKARHFIMLDDPAWLWQEVDQFLEAAKSRP